MIDWGINSSKLLHTFSEIDAAGHDVLDVDFAGGDTSYRTVKVPLSSLSISLLRSSTAAP